MARVQRASDPLDSDKEDEGHTLAQLGRCASSGSCLGGITLDRGPSFQRAFYSAASSDATMCGPRQRSRGASIVTTLADNDIDADDARLPSVPEDVVNALESDLAVEVDRSAEEKTPVVSTVPASSAAVRRRLVLVGGGRRVVLVPQYAGFPQSIQDVVESDDADEESRAVVNHFDLSMADSDLFGHPETSFGSWKHTTHPTRQPLSEQICRIEGR